MSVGIGLNSLSTNNSWNEKDVVTGNFGVMPRWCKFNIAVSGANFVITAPDGSKTTVARAAALTQSVAIYTTSTPTYVGQAIMGALVAFVGCASCVATLGVDLDGYRDEFIKAPAVLTAGFTLADGYYSATTVSGDDGAGIEDALYDLAGEPQSLYLTFTSTVNNLSLLTAGSLNVWVTLSQLL